MRIFRREIEIVLKAIGIVLLVSLVTLPVAWGYSERQKARAWQSIACAYRLKEVERRTPLLAGIEVGTEPCTTLERLGLTLEAPVPYRGAPAVTGARAPASSAATTVRANAAARSSPSGPSRTSAQ
jgi:hypothetical protein